MKDCEVSVGGGKFFSAPGYPWMGPLRADSGLVPALPEDAPEGDAMKGGDLPTKSGGKSTNPTGDPAMASPRLLPIPESPANSGEPVFPPIVGGSGETSASFDHQWAPS